MSYETVFFVRFAQGQHERQNVASRKNYFKPTKNSNNSNNNKDTLHETLYENKPSETFYVPKMITTSLKLYLCKVLTGSGQVKRNLRTKLIQINSGKP